MLNPIRTAFVPGRERVGRVDYVIAWIVSTALLVLAAILATTILAMLLAARSDTPEQAEVMLQGVISWITGIVILPASVYSGAVMGVRRLHDMGRTGRWMIAYYLTYAATLVLSIAGPLTGNASLTGISYVLTLGFAVASLALALLPGSRGENRYGPVPRS